MCGVDSRCGKSLYNSMFQPLSSVVERVVIIMVTHIDSDIGWVLIFEVALDLTNF